METDRQFYKWKFSPSALAGINVLKARDMVVDCFYHAQKETFQRAKIKLKKTVNDAEIRASVVNMIQLVCKTRGIDFDQPSKRDLYQVVEALDHKALAWGTPEEIVQANRKQIEAVLELL